ncbi:hypothetical protein VTI28DRAFT_2332 [Corynascus sepedonium]
MIVSSDQIGKVVSGPSGHAQMPESADVVLRAKDYGSTRHLPKPTSNGIAFLSPKHGGTGVANFKYRWRACSNKHPLFGRCGLINTRFQGLFGSIA